MTKKILIIEDNDKNRLLLSDIMKYYNYAVREAENGEEGLALAKTFMPDLIFLDMQMPVMDGFEVIKRLKNMVELKDIKVIAITSFAMNGDKEKIIALGADDYIAKPINTRQLPELVKRVI